MAAVNRELSELQVNRPEFVIKGHSRVWRISSSSPSTPEANRTSASSAPRPDTPVEGDNMEVSEREERPSGATTPSTYADVSRPATREKDPGNALSREIEGKELPPFEGKELPPFSPPLDQFPGALQRALADEPPPPPAPAPTTTTTVG